MFDCIDDLRGVFIWTALIAVSLHINLVGVRWFVRKLRARLLLAATAKDPDRRDDLINLETRLSERGND